MASVELFNKKLINKKFINKRGFNKGKGDIVIKLYIKLSIIFLILFKGFDNTLLFNLKLKK